MVALVERLRCIAVVSMYIAQAVAGTQDLPFTTPVGPVGFQAHSYNDLRIWPQLLRKGARAIKIDPNFQASSFCVHQQRVRNGTDPRGCFILNHNNPDASSSRYDYNGTDDLLALLDDAAFVREARRPQRLYIALCWKSVPGLPTPGCGQLQSSSAVASWVSLVDEFFAAAQTRIARNKLNMEFIHDSGVPHSCHLQRWRPWVSTSGPALAFESNNRTAGYDRWQVLNPSWTAVGSAASMPAATATHGLQSAAHGLRSGASCGDFAMCAKKSWGKKFGGNGTNQYAFQVWEPSDEKQISAALQTFVSAGVKHAPGLRFAINIDPKQWMGYISGAVDDSARFGGAEARVDVHNRAGAMDANETRWRPRFAWLGPTAPTHVFSVFEVGAAKAAVRANVSSHNILNESHRNGISDCSRYITCRACATARTWTGAHCRWCPLASDQGCHAEGSPYDQCAHNEYITDEQKCNAHAPLYYSFGEIVEGPVPKLSLSTMTALPSAETVLPNGASTLSVWKEANGKTNSLALLGDGNRHAFYELDVNAASCALRGNFTVDDTPSAVAFIASSPNPRLVQAFSPPSNGGSKPCDVALQLWDLPHSTTLQPVPLATTPICVAVGAALRNDSATAPESSVAIAALDYSVTNTSTTRDISVVVSYSVQKMVFAAVVELQVDKVGAVSVMSINGASSALVPQAIAVGVGTAPDISLALQPVSNDVVLALVWSDAYCWNSETHNKDAAVGVCDQVPTSTPGVLAYSYGMLHDWTRFLTNIATAGPIVEQWITPCNNALLHGTFALGSRPTVTLVPQHKFVQTARSSAAQTLTFIHMYEGFPNHGKDVGSCGAPVPRQGELVSGGWPMLELDS